MTDDIPPTTLSGSHTTTSSSDVRITDKLNMHLNTPTPTAVSFHNNTVNQDRPPSLSDVPTLQIWKAVTHADSNGTRVPTIIKKVMFRYISGDPMYLI